MSINSVGLLHPVVLDRQGNLIAGYRRIKAYEFLGETEIPHTVATSLDGAVSLLWAERDENVCRKALTPSEALALAERLEPLERQAAKERRHKGGQSGGRTAGRGRQKASAKFAEAYSDTGETRQK